MPKLDPLDPDLDQPTRKSRTPDTSRYDVKKDAGFRSLVVWLPVELYIAARVTAVQGERTLQAVVQEALELYLKKGKP